MHNFFFFFIQGEQGVQGCGSAGQFCWGGEVFWAFPEKICPQQVPWNYAIRQQLLHRPKSKLNACLKRSNWDVNSRLVVCYWKLSEICVQLMWLNLCLAACSLQVDNNMNLNLIRDDLTLSTQIVGCSQPVLNGMVDIKFFHIGLS